ARIEPRERPLAATVLEAQPHGLPIEPPERHLPSTARASRRANRLTSLLPSDDEKRGGVGALERADAKLALGRQSEEDVDHPARRYLEASCAAGGVPGWLRRQPRQVALGAIDG